MKNVEDKVVSAVIHGLIAAYIEKANPADVDGTFSDRAVELAKDYLAGKEIDDITLSDDFVEGTVRMLNNTFTDNATKQGYPNA